MMCRKRRTAITAAAFAVLLLLIPGSALRAEDIEARLTAMEAGIAADPDNLRLGSEYRQTIIQAEQYDRGIGFFEQLVAEHPEAANAQLNYGFAYVDKIPAAGSITQVLLANNALKAFTESIELHSTWIALYTRGNSYLYWPKIFGRASLGVADLEEAMKLQNSDGLQPYYVRTYLALGDGYWKMDDLEQARQVWAAGLKKFPAEERLKARLENEGDDLKAVIDDTYDITRRVDTSLAEMFQPQDGAAAR